MLFLINELKIFISIIFSLTFTDALKILKLASKYKPTVVQAIEQSVYIDASYLMAKFVKMTQRAR